MTFALPTFKFLATFVKQKVKRTDVRLLFCLFALLIYEKKCVGSKTSFFSITFLATLGKVIECGGRDLNPRTPMGIDLESIAVGHAWLPPQK